MGTNHGLALVVLVSLSSLSGRALAQTPPKDSGFALQQLELAPAGDTFFSVPDAKPRGLLELHEMAALDYAHRPLRLDRGADAVTHQALAHANVSGVAAEGLMLNIDLPYGLSQDGEALSDGDGAGLGDLRVALRAVVYATASHVLDGSLELDLWVPTGKEDALLGDGRVRFSPKWIAGGRKGPFAYTTNLGFLLRKHRDLGGPEVGNAITFGAGFGAVLFDQSLRVGPEIFGQAVLPKGEKAFLSEATTPMEALLGARLRVGSYVFGAAVGRGITRAPGTPLLRGIFSIAHTFDDRVLDADGDGTLDEDDRCPREPGFESQGCPAPDTDGDTVPDKLDACPNEAGLVDADPASNGCLPRRPARLPGNGTRGW